MKEQLNAVVDLVLGVWLKRRWILISLLIVCPLGWVSVTLLPNQYTSEARIYADTRSILQPLLRGLAIDTDPSQELALIVKTLLSRGNLETIARYADADIRATTSAEYEALLADLKANIRINSTGKENLFTISYKGSEPKYVKDIVQSALDVFVDNAVGSQRKDTDKAGQFIDQQIEEYELRLKDSESRLSKFKKDYSGYSPGDEQEFFRVLENRNQDLEATQLELREKRSQLNTAKAKLDEEKKLTQKQEFGVQTEYDGRLELLETRLDDLLYRFTSKHPDVKETKRQIEELKQLKKAAISKAAKDGKLLNSDQANYLQLLMRQLESDIASLRVREISQKEKIVKVEEKINQFPDIEAELISLMRNYDITKSKYEELLSRREAALISQRVGAASDDISFRVIDPPQLPTKPSGPIRPLYLTAVLILGLGIGFAISFLLSQIAPVVTSSDQLYKQTKIPVFGSVSLTDNSVQLKIHKRKTWLFVLTNVMIFLGFALFIVVNSSSKLHGIVMQEVAKL